MSIYDNPEEMFRLMTGGNPSLPRPSAFLSIPEASRRGRDLSAKLFSCWDRLRDLVKVYEPVIQKRWKKRTFAQRQSILRRVKPDLSQSHNPAIRLFYEKGINDRSELRDNYLLPYCNVEDLGRDCTHLLGLIHHRTLNPPQSFVAFDSCQLECGIYFQAIQRPFVNGCALKLYGDRSEYGELVEFDDVDKDGDSGWDKMDREDALAPADALTLLEAQEKLLSFLVSVIELLLQDLNTSPDYLRDASPAAAPLLCEGPNQNPNTTGTYWTSLSKTHFLQPYISPPTFEISRLSEIASGRNEQLQDHLWFMRTDPKYFYETVKEIDEHRIERLLGANKKPHEILQKPVYYDRLAGAAVDNAYSAASNWLLISQEVELVESIAKKTKVTPGKPLAEDYRNALSHLQLILEKVLKARIESVKALMMSNPAFRHLFVRTPTNPARPTIIGASLKGNTSLDTLYREDRLLWVLLSLSDKKYTFAFSLSNLLDEFDYTMEQSPKAEGARISQLLYDAVGDVAALNEMLVMLKYHRPCFPVAGGDDEMSLEQGRWSLLRLARAQGKLEDLKVGKFLTPIDKFQVPSGNIKAPEYDLKEKGAKEELDRFWREVDKKRSKSLTDMLEQLMREPKKKVQKGNSTVLGTTIKKELLPAAIKPVSMTVQSTAPTAEPLPEPITEKIKVKTRGVADPSYAPTQGESSKSALPAIVTASQKFQLTTRATKFLSVALPSLSGVAPIPVSKSQSALFDWLDFLHSMSILGFSMEKKRGSIWMLLDRDGRSFVVHEPHPTKKLSFWAARFIGKRLERRFGWEKDDFVLAEL